ncbi:protein roadkill-like [Haematobia irritans]|uniref:protein roadkill-like n=1 Tax=Haematobia irritans TaxID=7368 RepID=UPI003F500DE2
MFQEYWVIDAYELQSLWRYMYLTSPEFKDEDNNIWTLKLVMERLQSVNTVYTGSFNMRDVSIWLILVSGRKLSVTYNVSTKINSEKITFKSDTPIQFMQGHHLKLRNVCNSDQLQHLRSLCVFLTITQVKDSFPDQNSHLLSCSAKVHFGQLLLKGKLSDVILKANGESVKAHKAILSARSQVFSAMFDHHMEENKTGVVVIDDIKGDVLKEMLYFIYTGTSPKLNEFAVELAAAAEKYCLDDLKCLCSQHLIRNTNLQTVIDFLALADVYNMADLKSHTLKFINANDKEVVKSEGWKRIRTTHAHLVVLLYEMKLQ